MLLEHPNVYLHIRLPNRESGMLLPHCYNVSHNHSTLHRICRAGSTYRSEYTPPISRLVALPLKGVIGDVVGEPGEVGLGRKPLIVAVAFVDLKDAMLAAVSNMESRGSAYPVIGKDACRDDHIHTRFIRLISFGPKPEPLQNLLSISLV